MQVILKENVENLGFKDDLVKVKNGYGRNYLIPQGKAVLATNSSASSTMTNGLSIGQKITINNTDTSVSDYSGEHEVVDV